MRRNTKHNDKALVNRTRMPIDERNLPKTKNSFFLWRLQIVMRRWVKSRPSTDWKRRRILNDAVLACQDKSTKGPENKGLRPCPSIKNPQPTLPAGAKPVHS